MCYHNNLVSWDHPLFNATWESRSKFHKAFLDLFIQTLYERWYVIAITLATPFRDVTSASGQKCYCCVGTRLGMCPNLSEGFMCVCVCVCVLRFSNLDSMSPHPIHIRYPLHAHNVWFAWGHPNALAELRHSLAPPRQPTLDNTYIQHKSSHTY